MICKVITTVWTSADIIKILLTLIDIVRIHNLKKQKNSQAAGSFFAFLTTANPIGRVTDLLGSYGMVHLFYVN